MNRNINCIHQLDYWEDVCSSCDGLKDCRVIQPSKTEFFIAMKPPTETHQEKKITIIKGKPVFYEPPELKAARAKLMAHLSKHVPEKEYTGAIRLITKWCFPITGKHQDGEYKTSKPDTDNMIKMFKDCCTELGFWKDDAQVASEVIEKFWAKIPGIYVSIEELIE